MCTFPSRLHAALKHYFQEQEQSNPRKTQHIENISIFDRHVMTKQSSTLVKKAIPTSSPYVITDDSWLSLVQHHSTTQWIISHLKKLSVSSPTYSRISRTPQTVVIFSIKYPDIHVISLNNSCESDQQIQRQDKQCLNILSVPPLGGTLYVQDQLNSQRHKYLKNQAL